MMTTARLMPARELVSVSSFGLVAKLRQVEVRPGRPCRPQGRSDEQDLGTARLHKECADREGDREHRRWSRGRGVTGAFPVSASRGAASRSKTRPRSRLCPGAYPSCPLGQSECNLRELRQNPLPRPCHSPPAPCRKDACIPNLTRAQRQRRGGLTPTANNLHACCWPSSQPTSGQCRRTVVLHWILPGPLNRA
jgi:hypothetical protein